MECCPEDRETLKGKAHTYNHEILGKNKGKEAISKDSKPKLRKTERYQRSYS